MLRKIKLHGELAEFLGQDEFEAVVKTTAEAVKFLITNFPKLEAYMSNRYYQVLVGENEVDKDQIHDPIGKSEIHFVPIISGAGRGGLGKVLLGAALIGIAFATGGASLTFAQVPLANAGAFTGIAFSSGIAKAAVYLGGALVLSGVSDMLFPVPKPQEFKSEQDPQLSFSFSGTQNTSRAGTPVPIVYGEIVTGSVVISGAIDTQQVQA